MQDENIEKGSRKRTRKRVRNLERLHENCEHQLPGHVDYAAPGHALSEGYTDAMNQAKPDECKSAAQMAAAATAGRAGSPVTVAGFSRQRADTTPGRPGFGIATRTPDQGYTRAAVGHPDLQQQPATVFQSVLASLRANPYHFEGQSGFNGVLGATDRPAEAPGDQVTVRGFDAAGSAGGYRGMGEVDIAPRQPVSAYHQHRDSATAPNGTHSLGNVTSHAVSNKSRLDIIKDEMRKQGL